MLPSVASGPTQQQLGGSATVVQRRACFAAARLVGRAAQGGRCWQQQHGASSVIQQQPLLLLQQQQLSGAAGRRRRGGGMANLSAVAAAGSNGRFAGSSTAELEEWLESHGVRTQMYGKGAARTTADLLEEVARAESVLTVDPASSRALRLINVVNLYIMNDAGQVLIEAGQQLPDGRMRQRCLPLSEKMIGQEGWQAAAVRAVSEELATALPAEWRTHLRLHEATYLQLVEVQESTSYPGLLTQYTCHKVSAELPCLPKQPFSTAEPRPNGTLTSFWEWRQASPVAPAMMSSREEPDGK